MPNTARRPAAATPHDTLAGVSRFLRGNPNAPHCYDCLEDRLAARQLSDILKGYPGTPYTFEKSYCTVCSKWAVCVTYLLD